MFGKIDIGIKAHHIIKTMGWNRHEFTPDISRLEKYQHQLLFVCDDWLSDRRNRQVLLEEPGYEKKGVAFTQNAYRFYETSGYIGKHSVVFEGMTDSRKIKGEVVSLQPHSFLKLDRLRLNGVQSYRRRIHLIYPYRNPEDDIIFENTMEEFERQPHPSLTNGIQWNRKFPEGHPLAGKKRWLGPEKVFILQAWMYFGRWAYWKYYFPSQMIEVSRFTPKHEKKWLTEYYRYQNESS